MRYVHKNRDKISQWPINSIAF